MPRLWIDASDLKVRQSGRIVTVAVIVAVGANTEGRRAVLGMDIGPAEAEPFWVAFLPRLARRGLRGVKLVISDAHEGLQAAIAKVLTDTWQCWRVHVMRNGMSHAARMAGGWSPPSSPPPSPKTTQRPPGSHGAGSPTRSAPRSRSAPR